MTLEFDPDGAAAHDTLFGLPPGPAVVRVLPVPFDATTSSGQGTADAFPHILEASWQVDLHDPLAPEAFRAGIRLEEPLLPQLNGPARRDARLARDGDTDALARVNDASRVRTDAVHAWTAEQLAEGHIPAILGGDHSVPLGAMKAAIAHTPDLGILHIDAHADLRVAYEGFTESHASILHNVLDDNAVPLVQVGLRDIGRAEARRIEGDPRIFAWTDATIASELASGGTWAAVVDAIISRLPDTVWITLDIDGLDPSLCPQTGTPVPGGLSWRELQHLVVAVARHRRILGFDLCEVGAAPWDANVGARVLYKLSCLSLLSRGLS